MIEPLPILNFLDMVILMTLAVVFHFFGVLLTRKTCMTLSTAYAGVGE